MRRSVPSVLLLTLILTILSDGSARAQIAPLTFEVRGGATMPVEGLSDPEVGWAGDVGPSASFGMDFAYAFEPYVAGYGGFSQHRFGCRAESCGADTDLVATGIDAGVRFILGSGQLIPLVRTGVVTYRIEGSAPAEAASGARSITSHRSVGVEGGLALSVRLSPSLMLVPGVRYLRMTSDFGAVGDLPIRSVVADVGLMIGF